MAIWRKKKWTILIGVILLILSVVLLGVLFVEEPLRRYLEAKVNRALDGYTVTLEELDLRPVFTVKLRNLRISQDAHPDPPIVALHELEASIHWRALLSGNLVGDMLIREPVVFLDMNKIETERKGKVPVKERRWQQALAEMYPFKINHLEVENAKVTYTKKNNLRPLEIREVHLAVDNIRNAITPDNVYPSEIRLRARLFEGGALEADGRAAFLQEPHLGLKGSIRLTNLELSNFRPLLERSPVALKSGVLALADVSLEYAPKSKWVQVHSAVVRQLQGRYVHPGRGQEAVKKAAKKIAEKKKGEDEFWIQVEQIRIEESTLGFENTTTTPHYQIFLKDMQAEVQNYSNGFRKGDARIRLKGLFMGSGPLVLTGTFRSEVEGPDFNLNLVIEDTSMVAMNDLFRAYGHFDVAAGWFSLYSEAKVQKGRIEGYVKPLFREVDIYNKEQDESDGFFKKIYEGVVGAVAQFLENRPREEVATKTDISGTLKNPEADTLQTILLLMQNALFEVILPGLEHEL